MPQRAYLCGGVPGGAAGQLIALQQYGVGDTHFGQVIERGAAHDAAADHYDRCLFRK